MKFIADLHIHSKYSRATARNLDLENIYISAQIKGITVVGTGDFTHPAWWQEIQDKLEPAQEGLFQLKTDIARACDEQIPPLCRRPVRFMLVTEISNIYKKADRTRKNHNLIFMPNLASAGQVNRRLDAIGNIQSDGRPILGLDARHLLEIVLETDEQGFLIPAHIWTPWFSLLGSKSGFDTVAQCFEDLTPHIFALETGLSSDPPMNWRVSDLDRFTLISNSDAHSPAKLGREANCFDTELNYSAIRQAMETSDPDHFLGTIEFFPEEGKYHVDGHRKCGFFSQPRKTKDLNGLCPVCGKPLTLGVLYRVEELADRPDGTGPPKTNAFRNLIPLEDILAETLQVGAKTKKVGQAFDQLIHTYGSEFDILGEVPLEDLSQSRIPLLAEAIDRMRRNQIIFEPGYDGQFGRVRIFEPHEREDLRGQKTLFSTPANLSPVKDQSKPAPPVQTEKTKPEKEKPITAKPPDRPTPVLLQSAHPIQITLNAEQQAAVDHCGGPLLISAGPGTGKTRTITCRIVALINTNAVTADQILAVTFTHKAAEEMHRRLKETLPPAARLPLATTFHGLCWQLLNEKNKNEDQLWTIADEVNRKAVLDDAISWVTQNAAKAKAPSPEKLLEAIIQAKQLLLPPEADLDAIETGIHRKTLSAVYKTYQQVMTLQQMYDYEDLLFRMVLLLEKDPAFQRGIQKRFKYIFVDEFQDINYAQYRLLRALAPPESHVCVIGDPDQAIYGFRGSDLRYFKQFVSDYPQTRVIQLTRNYRSTETILTSAFQVIQSGPDVTGFSDRKRIFSNIYGTQTLSIIEAASPQAEAVAIGRTIEQMVGGLGFHSMDFDKLDSLNPAKEHSFNDFAVLCRTSAQVGFIGRKLIEAGIPCQTADRGALLQPGVIRLIAAFRVITSQAHYVDLNHLTHLNTTGVSPKTLSIFKQWAYAHQMPLIKALQTAHRLPIPGMSIPQQQRLTALLRVLEQLQKQCLMLTAADTVKHIGTETTLASQVNQEELDQIQALAEPYGMDKNAFGRSLSLQQDTDLFIPGVEKVAVMTLHAAKGLEFPIVFIAGCEDTLLPLKHAGDSHADPSEERRLFYVGLTRAREHLFLTWARKRMLYGQTRKQARSPFVADIEERLIKTWNSNVKTKKYKHEQLTLF